MVLAAVESMKGTAEPKKNNVSQRIRQALMPNRGESQSVGEQKEVAFTAKKVIQTAEEIVDEDVIRSDPNRTLIPEFIVDAVCHVPYAAHPSYTQGYYDRDNDFYLEWDKISESPETVKKYLEEWVFGVQDRDEYWRKLGEETHKRLTVQPKLAAAVDYGQY